MTDNDIVIAKDRESSKKCTLLLLIFLAMTKRGKTTPRSKTYLNLQRKNNLSSTESNDFLEDIFCLDTQWMSSIQPSSLDTSRIFDKDFDFAMSVRLQRCVSTFKPATELLQPLCRMFTLCFNQPSLSACHFQQFVTEFVYIFFSLLLLRSKLVNLFQLHQSLLSFNYLL